MKSQDWDAKGLCASTSYSPLLSALESLGLCDTKYCTFKPHPRVERVWWLSVVDIHCWVAWCNLRNVIRGIQLVAGPTHLLLLALLQIHWQFEILDQKMEVKLWNQALKSIDPLCLNVGEKWRLMSWKWMHTTCQVYYVWVGGKWNNGVPLLVFIALFGVCVFRMATCVVVLAGCTVPSPTRWSQEVVYWHGGQGEFCHWLSTSDVFQLSVLT